MTLSLTMKLVSLLVFLASLTYCKQQRTQMDCSDIYEQVNDRSSGVYTIYPYGERFGVEAYCDMETYGGRWTVIQRRMDGTVNFYRPYDQYKTGFGKADGEYWLGLEFIHLLSKRSKHELLVEMEDFEGANAFARYSYFSVGDECEGYKLEVSGFSEGGAGDALSRHNGSKFSTLDKDQDAYPKHCARLFLGAFWYKACHHTNPNGVYRWGADNTIPDVGIEWIPWKGHDYSMKTFSMKIRPAK